MRCQACDHRNREDARYCSGCGQSLPILCSKCGIKNSADSRFCDDCGSPLAFKPLTPPDLRGYTPPHLAQQILNTRSALEGELKQVTVLFCDIENSTEMAHRIGAEGMHELLNAFFDLALAEVHNLEGSINQFLGDGFMALFGAPVAHEDHVQRALLAALGIKRNLHEASGGDSLVSDLSVRMGINTGPVVVGKIGDNLRMDYTAVGDTTNLASRLQGLAEPGHIYVAEEVYAVANSFFSFTEHGKRSVKGIDRPVSVYGLQKERQRDGWGSLNPSLRIQSPLVGRTRQLALLEAELESLRLGNGGILVITGEPGAGKSRLIAELKERLPDEIRWLEGGAVSFGRSLSYWPFIELLKNGFDIRDDDSEVVSWNKMEQVLLPLFAERTSEVLPYLATVLARVVPAESADMVKYLDGPALRRQVFMCMRQLLEKLAEQQPVVLMLEDWHWADQSSVELTEHLLALADTTQLQVILTTRPDPAGVRTRMLQFASANPGVRFQEMELSPLTDGDSVQLLGNLLGKLDLPAKLHDQILRKTEGNPFYIEEVVRSLVVDGVLVRGSRENSWKLGQDIDDVNIPGTIQALLLARIDRLSDDVKQVLKLASVIGRHFFERVLKAIADDELNVSGGLEELHRVQLVLTGQQVPEVEYVFKHALVQEATYSSILTENRRSIHNRIAQATEQLFDGHLEEFTSLLAHHYARAEDWDKAQEYLFKAGDQAGRMAADSEALEHFRLAESAYLKAFGDKLTPIQRASLARKIGSALHGTGYYQEALEHFRRALAPLGVKYPEGRWGVRFVIFKHLFAHWVRRLRRKAGIPTGRPMDPAWAEEISIDCNVMSWMDYFLDKERMVLDSLFGLHAGETSTYQIAEARGLSSMAYVFMTFGARKLARRYHEEAGVIAAETGNPLVIGFGDFTLGSLEFFEGRWNDCVAVLHKSANAYRKAGDIHGWAGAINILSFVLYFQGELSEVLSLNAELVRIGRDAAEAQVETWGYQDIGYAMLARGPLDQALRDLTRGQAIAAGIPAWQNVVYLMALRSKCLVLIGDLETAESLIDEAYQIVANEQLRLPFDRVELYTAMAMLKLAAVERGGAGSDRNTKSDARKVCRQSLEYARKMPAWLPETLRLSGTERWLSGDQNAARNLWEESIRCASDAGFPIEAARAEMEMGNRFGDVTQIEKALATFQQTGANVFAAYALSGLARLGSGVIGSTANGSLQLFVDALAALEAVGVDYEMNRLREDLGHLRPEIGHSQTVVPQVIRKSVPDAR